MSNDISTPARYRFSWKAWVRRRRLLWTASSTTSVGSAPTDFDLRVSQLASPGPRFTDDVQHLGCDLSSASTASVAFPPSFVCYSGFNQIFHALFFYLVDLHCQGVLEDCWRRNTGRGHPSDGGFSLPLTGIQWSWCWARPQLGKWNDLSHLLGCIYDSKYKPMQGSPLHSRIAPYWLLSYL